MKKQALTVWCALMLTAVYAGAAGDNAADAAYSDGWQEGDNGGSGFSQWFFSDAAKSNGVARIESSTVNGGPSNIDTNGKSFCLANPDSNTNDVLNVFRLFDAELYPGQVFSLDMDVNWRNGYKGISVRDADDSASIFKFEVGNPGGGDDYYVQDAASGNGSIGNAYSDDTQFHIELEQVSYTGGVWRITRSGGVVSTNSGSYSGRPSSIRLFSFRADAGVENRIYFNNLDITGDIPVAEAADDRAADGAYDDGWQDQDNGGFGFSPWIFGGNAGTNSRAGIASSTANGGASAINTDRQSFYLRDSDSSGEYIDVFRFLEADLLPGQSFRVDMDVNWRGGYKGIRIRDADDASPIFRFEIGNPGGGDDHVVYDAATGNGSIGNAYSDNTQFRIVLKQDSATGGSWSIARTGGIADLDSGTYTGTVSSLQLYTIGAGSDSQQAVYYNNLAVSNADGFDYYTAWAESYQLGVGEDGFTDDPDSDQLQNLTEYGIGSDPTVSDRDAALGNALVNQSGTNWLLYVYNRRKNPAIYNIEYQVELAENLMFAGWSTNGYEELPAVDIGGGFESVTNRIPTTNTTRFVTLRVKAL